MTGDSANTDSGGRAQWMRLLALSTWDDLKAHATHVADVSHEVMRPPETGLVMLRGRMGAIGAPFNFGEATVTRCAVRLSDGTEGHAYVLGRNHDHARTAAVCDALLQSPATASMLSDSLIKPLAAKLQARQQISAGKAAATKVEFFTMVRGDD